MPFAPQNNLVKTSFVEVTTDTNTSSTSYVTLLTLNLTTGANQLLLDLSGNFTLTSTGARSMFVQILLDGTPIKGSNIITGSVSCYINLVHRLAVTTGAHTVLVQWKVGSTAYAAHCDVVSASDQAHCCLLAQEVAV